MPAKKSLKKSSRKTKIKRSRSAKRWLKSRNQTKCDIRGGCYKNFEKSMPVYVINCKMHRDRYGKFISHARSAKLKSCRSPCVLGKKFKNQTICQMIKDGLLSKDAEMTKIEVSINMSHYNAWQKLLNSCQDYALVLEDDIELKPDFIENVNLILESLEDKNISFSILHLWNGNWASTISSHKKIMDITSKIKIVQETQEYNAGAAAYIISKEYAKWLSDRFFPIVEPQDMMMGTYVKKGKHLSLKMKWDSKEDCYKSPLLDMPCGGEGGTGAQTTQEYNANNIYQIYEDTMKCTKFSRVKKEKK